MVYVTDPPRNARAMCDECLKWHRIQAGIHAALADHIQETNCGWTCQDNTDGDFVDCSFPQEKLNSEINEELEISDAYDAQAQQSPWSLIKSNLFLNRSRKTQTIDEVMVCHCEVPQDGRLGCGTTCLNRMLNIECVQGTCPCGELCSNQQFQKREYSKLKWFKCENKGHGLQALVDIPQGQYVIEYVGEVLDEHEYEARQREYGMKGHRDFYYMALNGTEIIDAWAKGNLSRFINHSCDPNCRTEKWMVNGEVCIGLFSLRDIRKGEEVTFDYSFVGVYGDAAKECECDYIGLVENDGEKVESLLSLLQNSGVVHSSIIPHLEGMRLFLDNDLVLKVLQTPCVPVGNLISFFSWISKKRRFKLTSQLLNELVHLICTRNRRREVYALWDLINDVGQKEKGVVSSECLNEIISEFSRLEKGNAAYVVFNKFEELGCAANADTYYLTIEVLCRRSFYDWAVPVCEKMLTADRLPDPGKVAKIISYLCKGGLAKHAHLVYLNAKNKNILLPRSSINAVVSSLCHIEKENYEEIDRESVCSAVELLNEYSAEDRKHAAKLFSSAIRKLCWVEDVDRAKKLLLEMVESGPPPGKVVFNFVINGLIKSEDVEEARSLMKVMESRGSRVKTGRLL